MTKVSAAPTRQTGREDGTRDYLFVPESIYLDDEIRRII
jgi:hypothetical protein